MRKIILTLMGAALIAGLTGQEAFAKQHHHAYASPYLLPQAASGGTSILDDTSCAMKGMYADNDANVYRDGQCRDDINPHGG